MTKFVGELLAKGHTADGMREIEHGCMTLTMERGERDKIKMSRVEI